MNNMPIFFFYQEIQLMYCGILYLAMAIILLNNVNTPVNVILLEIITTTSQGTLLIQSLNKNDAKLNSSLTRNVTLVAYVL